MFGFFDIIKKNNGSREIAEKLHACRLHMFTYSDEK